MQQMSSSKRLGAGLALSLVLCGVAFAQDDDRQQNQRDWERQHRRWEGQRGMDQDPRGNWRDPRDRDDRARRDADRDRRGDWGAGPDHAWHRGDRLPPEYRHRNYVVDDWRVHRLAPPPRGYQWMQYGGDYLLVAIGTGIIAQLVIGNR